MKSWRSILAFGLAVLAVVYLLVGWTDGDGDSPSRTGANQTADGGVEESSVSEVGDEGSGGDQPLGRTDTDPAPVGRDAPSIVAELDDGDYYNDFSDPLGDEWLIYNSVGHAGWGLRRPSAVGTADDPTAAGGRVLTITASMGVGEEEGLLVSGGMKLLRPQVYGRYTMRVRVDKDPAEVTSGVALLWPVSNRWPEDGEIDIFETWASRATRTPVESNLHWLNPEAEPPFARRDDVKALHLHEGIDGSQWHVYQLVWREDLVSISVDGNEPAILSTDPDEIADWNMEPTLQLDAFPSPLTPGLQPTVDQDVVMSIDYIAVED